MPFRQRKRTSWQIFLYLNDKIKEALNELSDFEGIFKEEIKEDEEGND